jgi:sugar phosphate isomerase/epimerase
MRRQTRRQFLHAAGAAATVVAAPFSTCAARPRSGNTITLGFSLYGMKSLKTEEAIRVVAEIGFDSVELCLMPGWDAEPKGLGPERRKDVRSVLDNTGLELTALMELVSLSGTAGSQQSVHERLKRAADLGHQLKPDRPPLIETTAGSGKWNDLRNQLRDNLGGWAKVAEATKTVIAVKPHRGGVVDRPEHGVWLIEQVKSPWIKLNYDYSHFAHRDIPLAESIRVMMPHTRFIHVKDTVMQNGKARFVLPGESAQIDYARLLKLVYQAGYRGDVCCEVSGMVFSQEGYDAVVAAKTCYQNLAPAFERAGIQRRPV